MAPDERDDIIVHERSLVLPSDTQRIDGIPVTRPELVVLQLASVYPSPDLIERVLHSMRRKKLITFGSMDGMLRRHARRGVPGVRVTRAALARWDPALRPTDSEMEVRLLQILRDQGVHGLVPQYEIFAADGRFIARVDLARPDCRLGIEYDSKEWHGDEISLERDNARRNEAFAEGWVILTARRRDIRNGGHEIARAVRAHLLAPKTAA